MSVKSVKVTKRCPENFLLRLLPNLEQAAAEAVLLAWSQKSCAKSPKNDTVRSLLWLERLSQGPVIEEEYKPPCP